MQRRMSGKNHPVTISEIRGQRQQSRSDRVTAEESLKIRLGYETNEGRTQNRVSITMRTPGNDAELAIGFLFTESIVRVELESGVDVDIGRLQRHFYTTSSCGVCGKTSLDALRVNGAQGDVGRHNAVDKVIGTLLSQGCLPAERYIQYLHG